MMIRKKAEEWITASAAAQILTANTDHPVSTDYVRMLAKNGKVRCRERNKRENEYFRDDIEEYRVRPKHTPRVRPRPSTKQEQKQDTQPDAA
jgi:hypothetical protein